MNRKITNQIQFVWSVFGSKMTVVVSILMLAAFSMHAQDTVAIPTPRPALEPAIRDLRGVSVDMTLDAATEKLGKPKVADKAGLYYEFSKSESAQIGIDDKKKVRTIALIFSSDSSNIPTFAEVFGPDVPMVEKKDGSIYKMIRYTKAGYWIAYNRSAGKKPMTIITMRRMAKPTH